MNKNGHLEKNHFQNDISLKVLVKRFLLKLNFEVRLLFAAVRCTSNVHIRMWTYNDYGQTKINRTPLRSNEITIISILVSCCLDTQSSRPALYLCNVPSSVQIIWGHRTALRTLKPSCWYNSVIWHSIRLRLWAQCKTMNASRWKRCSTSYTWYIYTQIHKYMADCNSSENKRLLKVPGQWSHGTSKTKDRKRRRTRKEKKITKPRWTQWIVFTHRKVL